jgi:transposase
MPVRAPDSGGVWFCLTIRVLTGLKKAVIAVAHAILVTAYHILAHKTTYREPGADYYERRHADRARHRAIQALERQGYRVTLEPPA